MFSYLAGVHGMSEKTEQATAYKLKKAKEKGQVSKSVELTTYLSLLVTLGLLTVLWPQQLATAKSLLSHLFYLAAHMHFTVHHVNYLNQLIWSQALNLWLPVAGTLLLTVILTTLMQTGLTWAPAALKPDFNRLNIVKGFKKLASLASFFDAFKALIKLTCSFIFLYFVFKNQLHTLIQNTLNQQDLNIPMLAHFILKTSLQLVLLLLLFALIDKKFTLWKFSKDQRMSKQDLKEEHKQKEGDPKVKNKIRQLQTQLRQKTAALKQVPTADVIVTNPTHIAIALKYERNLMPAPKVIFKAQDKMVSQVKELAKKHNIPIIEHKILARLLYHSTELNQYIHKDLFPLTAQLFRELYQRTERS
jgi:flagellar biosynthetic protein FlhB/flagellar biosynthetic protein FliR/FlhB